MHFEKTCARDSITVAINVRSFVFVKPDDGVNSETSFWINVLSLTFGLYELNFVLFRKT